MGLQDEQPGIKKRGVVKVCPRCKGKMIYDDENEQYVCQRTDGESSCGYTMDA